jgi:2-keto-3-deoxy-L-rhamnonate aldolase RhmA
MSLASRIQSEGPQLGAYLMVCFELEIRISITPRTTKYKLQDQLTQLRGQFESPFSAKILSSTGYDWVLIDMEHSPLSARDATALVQAVAVGSRGRCAPMIRIPSHGVEYVKWALDAGASGLVVPMVSTKAEVELVIKHARYPPVGQRSFGPFQAPYADLSHDSDMAKYFTQTVKDVSIVPMIESRQGVENAEAIMSTTGVSGVFVGPVDLRLSMGFAGAHGSEEEYLAALKRLVDIGNRNNIPVGIFAATPDILKMLVAMGFTFFLVGGDLMALTLGATEILNKSKAALGEAKL